MSDDNFNPDDIEELNKTFEQIIKDTENGYLVELYISKLAAREMIDEWLQAMLGVRESIGKCVQNYGYIVNCIIEEVKKDDNDV